MGPTAAHQDRDPLTSSVGAANSIGAIFGDASGIGIEKQTVYKAVDRNDASSYASTGAVLDLTEAGAQGELVVDPFVKATQQYLKDRGFDPGPIDGQNGRRTMAAIRAFQRAEGLVADGIVGPVTKAALFGAKKAPTTVVDPSMPWLAEAYALIGTKEDVGQGLSEAIIGWAKALRIDYSDDETPWCGLFVAHCIGSILVNEPLPTYPLSARAWRKLGNEVKPQVGSVLVFWRGSPSGWKGHVGFYWAEDSSTYHVLGGNQSNKVSVTRISKDRLITARWPATGLAPSGQVRTADARGRLSTNEQ